MAAAVVPTLPDSVAELQRTILAQKKTIQVLTKQIAKKQSESGSALDHLRQNRLLEEVVQRKTHELDAEREKLHLRNRDMRLLLDNVAEGFLTVDSEGTISTERSAAVNRWLGEPDETSSWVRDTTKFWDYIARVDPEAGCRIELVWQLIKDDILPLEIALTQLPVEFRSTGRNHHIEFRITYRQIQDSRKNEALRLLVVITDVTLQREKERTEEREREVSRVIEHAIRDRHAFFEFLDEADALLRAGIDPNAARDDRMRALHTLKGNCGVFGFSSFARLCHEQEEKLSFVVVGSDGQEAKEPDGDCGNGNDGDGGNGGGCGVVELADSLTAASSVALEEAWASVTRVFRHLRERSFSKDIVEVRRDDLESLIVAIEQSSAPRARIAKSLRELLTLDRLERRFDRLAELARSTARQLGKEINVVVDDGGVLIDSRKCTPLLLALSHIVRNAVDHGIEIPSERVEKNKAPIGTVSLKATRGAPCPSSSDETIELRLSDDGRGIDWDAARERASELGLPSETRDDLKRAILSHGFSTRSEASEISGRGVGLDAVVRAVQARGGTVDLVDGEGGIGTMFVIRVPWSFGL